MTAVNVPQGMLYNTGYGQQSNAYRDRSGEQAATQGAQQMIPQFNYGMDPTQSSNLGRYVPPMMGSGGQGWQGQGGYSYNVPNSFGNFMGNYGGPGPMGNNLMGPQNQQIGTPSGRQPNQDMLAQLQQLFAAGGPRARMSGMAVGGAGDRMGTPGLGQLSELMGRRAPVPQMERPAMRERSPSFNHDVREMPVQEQDGRRRYMPMFTGRRRG